MTTCLEEVEQTTYLTRRFCHLFDLERLFWFPATVMADFVGMLGGFIVGVGYLDIA